MRSRIKKLLKRMAGSRLQSPAQGTGGKKPRVYHRASMENLYDAVDFLRATTLDGMNRDLVRRIRAEVRDGRSVNVGFVVNDRSKWNADSLLEEMRDVGWSTQLYLARGNLGKVSQDDRMAAYQAERDFFSRIDAELVDLYDWKHDRELPVEDMVQADVVFYQQPWEMKDFPRRLAGRALSAYLHYGFMMMANHEMHYNIGTFHSYLWRYFTQTEEHRLLHLQHDPTAYDKLVVTGYPKFDVYLSEGDGRASPVWPGGDESAARVIYAPHHSLGSDNLGMSTFAWNHDLMLELARTTPNTQWVYKPHPTLKYSVARNNLMTRSEYSRYEKAWSELPNAAVYDDGNYFDVFRSSDVMITDSGSFLAEYLPTGSPIIWLVSSTTVGFNAVGRSLSEAFYQARSVADIQEIFQRVVVDRQDPLKEKRERASRTLFPTSGKAATAIVDHLREHLADDRGR